MKRYLVAIAASSALLCAGSAGPETVSYAAPSTEILSAHDAAAAQSVFEGAKRYWDSRRVGNMAAVRLVMLSGNETFVCHDVNGDEGRLSPSSVTKYCEGEDTVVYTALQNNALKYAGGGDIANAFDMAHEMGHAVQARTAKEKFLEAASSDTVLKEMELQATTYAGEYMATVYALDQLQKVASFVCTVPPDGFHGSPAEQTDAFLQGVKLSRPKYSLHGC